MAPVTEQEKRGPGRPSTGARERVLEAALETLLEEGYAGLTYAKVAAGAGENKSLISYYFGTRQGLVGAVAERVGNEITEKVVAELGEPQSVGGIARGMLAGLWKVMDEDHRIARLYFDLSAVSVVDPEIREALHEVKARWAEVISGDLATVGVDPGQVSALTTLLIAGVEGLAIERLGAASSQERQKIEEASELFIGAAGQITG